MAALVVAYAFSPIDLIPDFIPVIGYLDDLILVPLGIYLTLRLIPPHVLADARIKADAWLAERRTKPKNYWMAAIIVAVWVLAGLLIVTAVLAAPNEIKVFTDELADYRESTLETHANKASRGPLQVMPEYSYGIWRNWERVLPSGAEPRPSNDRFCACSGKTKGPASSTRTRCFFKRSLANRCCAATAPNVPPPTIMISNGRASGRRPRPASGRSLGSALSSASGRLLQM